MKVNAVVEAEELRIDDNENAKINVVLRQKKHSQEATRSSQCSVMLCDSEIYLIYCLHGKVLHEKSNIANE